LASSAVNGGLSSVIGSSPAQVELAIQPQLVDPMTAAADTVSVSEITPGAGTLPRRAILALLSCAGSNAIFSSRRIERAPVLQF